MQLPIEEGPGGEGSAAIKRGFLQRHRPSPFPLEVKELTQEEARGGIHGDTRLGKAKRQQRQRGTCPDVAVGWKASHFLLASA